MFVTEISFVVNFDESAAKTCSKHVPNLQNHDTSQNPDIVTFPSESMFSLHHDRGSVIMDQSLRYRQLHTSACAVKPMQKVI